ncbi:MAG TPA: MBL fold metallo-hydrolase [Trueperaceae bacterium]|nr:MBL fold metallo-hydrolase [Trueperaceae bacterium]
MNLSVYLFTVGPLQENCYLLADEKSKAAVLIDPGDDADLLLGVLKEKNYKLQAIWLTHAHFDHVGAVEDITQAFDVPVLLHAKDNILYDNAAMAAARWEITIKQPSKKPTELKDGQILKLGDTEVECIFTPGHAPGHIAFYIKSEKLLLSGDALFKEGIGRTDLPFGDHQQLLKSIKERLFVLPDDTNVYSGHGEGTTIAHEKEYNPFVS